jgi:hypothetical protein
MVKVNGKEVEWKKFPEGWYLTNVKYHVLWKNEDTGAMFILIKIPVGGLHELIHTHPQADQMVFGLTGCMIRGGRSLSIGECHYTFGHSSKGKYHGPPKESEITQETIMLQYYDGPPTRINEGETIELTLE